MKKTILLLFGLSGHFLFSQVGIGTATPNATLDVVAKTTDGSKPEGIIAPRLTGDQIKAADLQYGNNQKGALVYATQATTAPVGKTINITEEGYYYFDGSVWLRLSNRNLNIYNADGTLQANRTVAMSDKTLNFNSAATTGTSHFTVDGSTLNVDAVNNRVGFGTVSPAYSVDVNGSLRSSSIVDANQQKGSTDQVITSDGADGYIWKKSVSVKSTVIGTIPSVQTFTVSLANNTKYYTGAYIAVSPGSWIISLGGTIAAGSTISGLDGQLWCHAFLSNVGGAIGTTSGFVQSPYIDTTTGGAIAGTISRGAALGIINGSFIVKNTSGTTQTFYVWVDSNPTSVAERWKNPFSSAQTSEGWFYATPIND